MNLYKLLIDGCDIFLVEWLDSIRKYIYLLRNVWKGKNFLWIVKDVKCNMCF